MKLLILDLDGTVRQPKSGAKFINKPDDQVIIPAAAKGIAHAKQQGFQIVGVTNQGGVKAGFKTLNEAIEEQRITLNLCPELEKIYFCPDNGETCWLVTRDEPEYERDILISEGVYCFENTPHLSIPGKKFYDSFRKPGPGMLMLAIDLKGTPDQVWMIGDRPEDLAAAEAAGVPFLPAELWHQRFSPGIQEMGQVTAAQLEFLEGMDSTHVLSPQP